MILAAAGVWETIAVYQKNPLSIPKTPLMIYPIAPIIIQNPLPPLTPQATPLEFLVCQFQYIHETHVSAARFACSAKTRMNG